MTNEKIPNFKFWDIKANDKAEEIVVWREGKLSKDNLFGLRRGKTSFKTPAMIKTNKKIEK